MLKIKREYFNSNSKFTASLKRTKTQYKSMPLDVLKQENKWNIRLEKIIPHLPHGVWIAGGFLRAMVAGDDELDGDIDFFTQNIHKIEQFLETIKNSQIQVFQHYSIEKSTGDIVNCISDIEFRPNLQFIKFQVFDSPEHVIDTFDFTCCQLATDGKTLWFAPDTFDDIKNRKINIHRITGNPIAVLNRILKYQNKGYKIDSKLFKEKEKEAMVFLASSGNAYSIFEEIKIDKKHPYPYAVAHLNLSPLTHDEYVKAVKNYKNSINNYGTITVNKLYKYNTTTNEAYNPPW